MFQHTAARRRLPTTFGDVFVLGVVSTHSRPKAAAKDKFVLNNSSLFQHTAARRRLHTRRATETKAGTFQHTAARRRLQAG